MSWLQIKELYNNGYVIGNHTFDHLRLSEIPFDVQYKQIVDSKSIIEETLRKMRLLCFYLMGKNPILIQRL